MLGFLDQLKSTLSGKFLYTARIDDDAETATPFPDYPKSVNFVWLRNKPQPKADLSDPLPEKYGHNILETARINPDSSVVLWVDKAHWNRLANQKLIALCGHAELPNLSLRFLPEIPEYRTNKLFTKTRKGFYDHTDPIWQKVDFARVMVLRHLLETTDAKQVFYADVDLITPPFFT